jgi:hypothetical protein
MRRRAFAALRELFERMTDSIAVVLAIDDVQWGDIDSADLLGYLLRGPRPPPLLLILGCRTEDRENSPFGGLLSAHHDGGVDAAIQEIDLGPLSPAAATQLARGLDPGLDEALAAAVACESGGIPFFVCELVRYLAHRKDELAAGPGGPVRLEHLLRDRLLQLPDGARRLLEVIAIASHPIAETIAASAADLPEGVQESMRELRRANLVRGSIVGETALVETLHDRIRETVLAELDPDVARAHHHRLALALEAAGHTDPEMLAAHFRAAGQREKAGVYAALAAEQATRALAFERAVRLYRLALELGSFGEAARRALRVALGDALTNAGRGPEAAEAYLAASEGAESEMAQALESSAAGQLLLSGHIDHGFAVLRDVLGAIGMELPSTRQQALLFILVRRLWLRLRGMSFERRSAEAVPQAELRRIDACWPIGLYLSSVDPVRGAYFQLINLLLSLHCGEPTRIARSLCVEAGYTSVGGRKALHRTRQLLDTARELAEQVQQPYVTALHTLAQGIAEESWAKAGELCTRSEQMFREHCRGVTWELSNCQFFALNSLLMRGDLRELKARLPAVIESAQEHGDLFAESFLRLRFLSLVRLADNDPSSAEHQHSILGDRLSAGDYFLQHYWRLHAEVQLDLYNGRACAAWDRIASLWMNLKRSHLLRMQFHRIDAAHLRARAALATAEGRSEAEARALLKHAAAEARVLAAESTPRSSSLASLVLAALEARAGRLANADGLLARAATSLDAVGMRLFAAVARRRRGALAGGAEGRALVESGDAFMEEQGIRNRERMTALLAPGFQD